MINSYFSDTEATVACIRLLAPCDVMWWNKLWVLNMKWWNVKQQFCLNSATTNWGSKEMKCNTKLKIAISRTNQSRVLPWDSQIQFYSQPSRDRNLHCRLYVVETPEVHIIIHIIITIKPHRSTTFRPIVTDWVSLSVGPSICLSVWHSSEPCKNGWTDRDAVWDEDSEKSKEPRIRWRCRSVFHGKGQFLGERGRPVVKYSDSLCKNGWTDWGALWDLDSGGPKEACIGWECTLAPPGEYKKASIRWQDSERRQFQAGLRGDVGL